MTLTLGIPEIVILVFVIVTQAWAWTRDSSSGYLAFSDRALAVLFATFIDLLFIAVVGGIWIW